jgi:circadian clock protein KaiB
MSFPGADRVRPTNGGAPDQDTERYELRLYVTGATPSSGRAIANLKAFCEEHLRDRYDLEVVDIYQQPRRVEEDRIVATPTLIKRLPLPLRRLVGDLSDSADVLSRLDLSPET